MADHDPLCFCDEFGVCICKELERRDARVRADERERVITTLIDASGIGNVIAAAATAHAEALVLADLRAKVEALRRPPAHSTRPTSNGPHCQCNPCVSNRALDRVLALLDAAQHRELVDDGNSQPLEQVASRVRAEVAALQVLAQDANEAFAAGRREVLPDLRDKVMNLPSRVELNEAGHEQTWVRYADILALIEEAGQ